MLTFQSPVSEIRGIGKARAAVLEHVGIRTASDLLWFFPRSYQNRGDVRPVSMDSVDGMRHSYLLTVATQPRTVRLPSRRTLTKFRATDESGTVELAFFNQPYLSGTFHVGEEYRFYGVLQRIKTSYQMTGAAYEKYDPASPPADLVPIYRLPEGMTRRALEDAVHTAAEALLPRLKDPLPGELRERHGLASLAYAVRSIHQPEDTEALRRAARRLVFDEVLFHYLQVSVCADARPTEGGLRFPRQDLSAFFRFLPFSPTGAQRRTIEEIQRDTGRDGKVPPMNRIVVGDVGSGKTLCAEAALYLAAQNGYRAMLMVPTEILARQHFSEMEPLFRALGFRTALLCGSRKEREKTAVLSGMVTDDPAERIDLMIGTHALLSERVRCEHLGLIVTDEQHRFGVAQRAALGKKGEEMPHVLVMSATPIPRTLSLALYGDLDVSRIDELPPGRQKIDTFVVGEAYRARLNAFIRKNVEEGGQVYIVCPAIEPEKQEGDAENAPGTGLGELLFAAEDRPPLRYAVEYAEELRDRVFPDIPVECLHGRMKPAERDDVMARFASGITKILVCTTVIEVGVNVPEATLMIVENAERFGLSQLHQLRGRVGRGKRKSYCVLVSDSKGETARERLSVMKQTNDGFVIAERDLALRGPGDFLAAAGEKLRQHGDAGLRLAAAWQDAETFREAEDEARRFRETDPGLRLPEHAALRSAVLGSVERDPGKLN